MRISAVINRLWGDISAQPVAVALLGAAIVALAFLAAVGLVLVARRTERWVRARVECRRWRRSTGPGPLFPVGQGEHRAPYPELLPPPGVAGLRNSRAARRLMLEQVEAHLAERSEAS